MLETKSMLFSSASGNGLFQLVLNNVLLSASRGGFMDTGNYRNRVLTPLAEKLGFPKLNFQIMRRTMATQAQSMGSVKDIQAHLRHAKADTTANEYMQELPESVKRMVASVYAMLIREGQQQQVLERLPPKLPITQRGSL